ncbi:MAG: hypothetical protein HRU26_16005 [Psychroserpens sp.]|nr:hypothetical protein [Psychroserpens sp.]
MKHLLIDKNTHKQIKDYCLKRNKTLQGTADQIILEGIRVLKIKEASQEAI